MMIEEIMRKLGLDKIGVSKDDVEIIDYSSMSDDEILRRIMQLKEEIRGFNDETLEDVESLMELKALEEELHKRIKSRVILKLEENLPLILNKSRIRILKELEKRGSISISELAKILGENALRVSEDLKTLERLGLISCENNIVRLLVREIVIII